MGKILDIVLAVIVVFFSIYVFVRLGVTLGDLVHDVKLFIYGSKASVIIGWLKLFIYGSKASVIIGWLK